MNHDALRNIEDRALAYRLGIHDAQHNKESVARMIEARNAVESWGKARFDHAETSYWGRRHVDAMMAYWLGQLRTMRWLLSRGGTPRRRPAPEKGATCSR